jgi:hypothetical protein
MVWTVRFGDEFEPEFLALSQEVQDGIVAIVKVL